MPREPKYKAWGTDVKTMGEPWTITELIEAAFELSRAFSGKSVEELIETFSGHIFLEYTGMEDKNGVEIYEADIVEIEDETYAIVWCEHEGNWAITKTPEDPEKEHFVMGGQIRANGKVIGNLYPNPELLK